MLFLFKDYNYQDIIDLSVLLSVLSHVDNNGDDDLYRCVNVALAGSVESLCLERESLFPCRLTESERLESELVSDVLHV